MYTGMVGAEQVGWRSYRPRNHASSPSDGQRGAFTTPCPRRNAAPRPLVYKSRKLPRRGVPTGAGRPGAIAATRPGISAGARLRGVSREGGDCAWAGDPGGEVTNLGARRRSGTRDAAAWTLS